MAARNSARSRAAVSAQSGQSYSGADGQVDELGVFEEDEFDAEEFCRLKCQSMSEKVRRRLCNWPHFEKTRSTGTLEESAAVCKMLYVLCCVSPFG